MSAITVVLLILVIILVISNVMQWILTGGLVLSKKENDDAHANFQKAQFAIMDSMDALMKLQDKQTEVMTYLAEEVTKLKGDK